VLLAGGPKALRITLGQLEACCGFSWICLETLIIIISTILRYMSIFIAIGAACLAAFLIWTTLKEYTNTQDSLVSVVVFFIIELLEILRITWNILGVSGTVWTTTLITILNLEILGKGD
jgi:hypothetical protein